MTVIPTNSFSTQEIEKAIQEVLDAVRLASTTHTPLPQQVIGLGETLIQDFDKDILLQLSKTIPENNQFFEKLCEGSQKRTRSLLLSTIDGDIPIRDKIEKLEAAANKPLGVCVFVAQKLYEFAQEPSNKETHHWLNSYYCEILEGMFSAFLLFQALAVKKLSAVLAGKIVSSHQSHQFLQVAEQASKALVPSHTVPQTEIGFSAIATMVENAYAQYLDQALAKGADINLLKALENGFYQPLLHPTIVAALPNIRQTLCNRGQDGRLTVECIEELIQKLPPEHSSAQAMFTTALKGGAFQTKRSSPRYVS